MTKITMVDALEKLAELNETGDKTLVQTNFGEPIAIGEKLR